MAGAGPADTLDDDLLALKMDFDRYDKDGSGSISIEELHKVFEARGFKASRESIKEIISKVDTNSNGSVEFGEFKKLTSIMEEDLQNELNQQHVSLETEYREDVKKEKEEKLPVFTASGDIAVGPVVGKVTHDTARILIETTKDCSISISYAPADASAPAKTEAKQCPAASPVVFALTGLTPGTKYNFEFQGIADRSGSFRTFSPEQKEFRIIAASCDKGKKKRGPHNMYEKMYEEYIKPSKLDLFVRHGDQVYADSAFAAGEEILANESIAEKDKDLAILNKYKDVYRSTWNEQDVRRVHANCQTLMLWDDHELRNDWGSKSQDTDTKSLDYRIAYQARTAYRLYQRQLWDDLGPLSDATKKARLEEAPHYFNREAPTKLEVVVLSGNNLLVADSNTSDPYVEAALVGLDGRLIGSGVKSAVVRENHMNPVWKFNAVSSTPFSTGCCGARDPFSLRVSASDLKQAYILRFRVFDHDRISKNDFLGEAVLSLRFGEIKEGINKYTLPLLDSYDNSVNTGRHPTGSIEVQVDVALGALDKEKAVDRLYESEGSFHVWGPFGVMIIDGRGARSFYAQQGDLRPYVGSQQWYHLRRALSPTGLFKDVKSLTVVHSTPVVLMSTSSSSMMGNIPPQLDKMGFGLHPKEQAEYLKTLDQWAHPEGEEKNEKRFLLVGGDMHFAVQTDISELVPATGLGKSKGTGRIICQQLILSAISNSCPPKAVYWMLRKFMKGHGVLGASKQLQKYAFRHQAFYYQRNFGVIDMTADGQITPTIITAGEEPPED
eukprot:gb/GEZN01001971.1/.p1 GENE.gb/GEZN01001971.1/~~gb/GEZN01001971.1/.p1  ORF type:complete len:781 (+),score=89.66 gb/GEZN01001971.1/:195-2537(+)